MQLELTRLQIQLLIDLLLDSGEQEGQELLEYLQENLGS